MEELVSALLNNGPMGIVAALLFYQMMTERKDRKSAEKALNDHLAQDIKDKIEDREVLKQTIELIKGIKRDV